MRAYFMVAVAVISLPIFAEAGDGPVGEWLLAEGSGDTVRDSAGQSGTGQVHGAQWIPRGDGYALSFDGQRAHVNCGAPDALDIHGAITLDAWVYPTARAASETGVAGKSFESYGLTLYADGQFYWYIGSGANKCHAPARTGRWNHMTCTFDGTTLGIFLDGAPYDTAPSQFPAVNPGGPFFIGCIARDAAGNSLTDSFKGYIGGVRVYDRVLSEDEIRLLHERDKGLFPRMDRDKNRLTLTPYFYFDTGEIFVDVDFGTLFPWAADTQAEVSLWRTEPEQKLMTIPVASVPDGDVITDLRFDLKDVAPGVYEIRAVLTGPAGKIAEDRAPFSYPKDAALPLPEERTAPPLARPPELAAYTTEACPGGGIRVTLGADTYLIESTFSYPGGGENRLAAGDTPPSGEASWRVKTEIGVESTDFVEADGETYTLSRAVTKGTTRIEVRDTFTNKTDAPLGIIISNHINAVGVPGVSNTFMDNPATFLSKENGGIGMVALDDVYLEHYRHFNQDGVTGLRDPLFALDKGASYTLEWAVYVNGTGDYYDFINAARKDEGLVRTVEGGFSFIDLKEPPSKEFVDLRGLKYVSLPCLSHAEDDAGISIEGFEFMEYPAECALVKQTLARTRALYPDLKVMFHVAHSLYATDKPETLFPDSRTINNEGRQTDYGDNNTDYYRNYFSKEHVDEGYRWFIFYPAEDNSFGKYMLRATRFMLDEVGATGIFADGLTHGYGGRFTYDRWDGHTAQIDPKTGTIQRLYASVNLLAAPVLVEMTRMIGEEGGVVIANSNPGPRTVHQENILYCVETGGGDKSVASLYLAPTVIALGDSSRIKTERDVYDDIRAKLDWGALYFYYGEGTLTRPTPATRMYPITVEAFRPGTITGRERIITTRSGVFGWPGEHNLHQVLRYDGRGALTRAEALTTVDAVDARTELSLGDRETAVIEKLPIWLETAGSVNAVCIRYDREELRLRLAGTGEVRLSIANGPYKVRRDASHAITVGATRQEVMDQDGVLYVPFALEGMTEIAVVPSQGTGSAGA